MPRLERQARMVFTDHAQAGLANGAVWTSGKINVQDFVRVRGTIFQDVLAGASVVVEFRDAASNLVQAYTIPQDAGQPNFTYTYDVIVVAPYVTITFTNGAGVSTVFRARNEALP